MLLQIRVIGSLTCARYSSSCQKLEGSCPAQPVVMVLLDVVVVLLEQAVVAVIVVIVCVVRVCSWRNRQSNDRGTINEMIRGLVFCT